MRGTGSGSGCSSSDKVEVRLKWDRVGPDSVLASGSRFGDGSVSLVAACSWSSNRKIYVETKAGGQTVQSARLTTNCS